MFGYLKGYRAVLKPDGLICGWGIAFRCIGAINQHVQSISFDYPSEIVNSLLHLEM
jgi:hypothetical protein